MDDVKTVGFTAMKDGSRADYKLLEELEKPYLAGTSRRVLDELDRQGKVSPSRDGADIDWVVGALLHDIGDGLAPQNHDRFSAEVIRPFVREEVSWVVEHHGIFQMIYYAHHYGWDKNARDEFKDHPGFESCSEFCERWDQSSFDPEYPAEPLSFFEPMVERVFSRKAYDPDVIQAGVYKGMPSSGQS